MKNINIIKLLLLLIIGNYFCLKFSLARDATRFLAFAGWGLIAFTFVELTIRITKLFFSRALSSSEKNHTIFKRVLLSVIVVSLMSFLIGAHILGYRKFFDYQTDLLERDGICTKAIVTDKQWVFKGRSAPSESYVRYSFKNNQNTHEYTYANDSVNIGDTLVVKYATSNPDNHEVIKCIRSGSKNR